MKKHILSVLALCSIFPTATAFATSADDLPFRLEAIEKENAAMKREIAALRENKRLREHKTALQRDVVRLEPTNTGSKLPSSDPFGAYAADRPMAYRARPETRGQFRIWAEGGAILTSGDPTQQSYSLLDFSTLLFPSSPLGPSQGPSGFVDLKPKVGWEAATGFDYRFSDQLWHVSGQFRYGVSRSSGSATNSGGADPAIFAAAGFPLPPGFSTSGSDQRSFGNTETHWQADLAVGRDVLGNGPDAMQVKLGVRIAEFEQKLSTRSRLTFNENLGGPQNINGVVLSSLGIDSTTDIDTRNSFFGAGPRLGVEGAIPLPGNWSFDYQGDAAVLFGQQRITSSSNTAFITQPAFLLALIGGSSGAATTSSTDQRFATVFNADVQVGVSYWLTEQVRLSASYRLDAYFNVLATTIGSSAAGTTTQTVDRYIHGPRVGISASF